MKTKLLVVLMAVLSLLLVTPLLFPMFAKAESESKILKMGTVMPVSGPLGTIGLAWDKGYDLAADMVNERGGLKVGGETYRIKFVHEDGKGSPQACAAAANKLVYQDKVKFVFGAIMTPTGQAVYSVARSAGVLQVLAYTQDPFVEDLWGVSPQNPLLVLLMPPTYLAYGGFCDYLVKAYPNVKKVVHAEMTIPFNRLIEVETNAAKASGLDVVGVERWDGSWTDFYPFITRCLTHKPDALIIEHAGPDQMALMIKAAREQGFSGPIVSMGSAAAGIILAQAGAKNCHDILVDQAYAADPDAPEAMKDVMKRWKAKYPGDLWFSDPLMPFDEAWVLSQAIEKANSLDPKKVLNTLEGMTTPGSLKTTFGPGHMGGLKTVGVNRVLVRPFPITFMQGKDIKMVKWLTPDMP
jgi:branched-chain amino acid transport system substrate-binding protein